mgnify:CR=1 FL=1
MATPNLANVATIKPVFVSAAITTGGAVNVTVPAESCYKIESIYISNKDGTNTATASVYLSSDGGSSNQYLIHLVPVPPGSTVSLLDTPLYLDETDRISSEASANGDLDILISGTELID